MYHVHRSAQTIKHTENIFKFWNTHVILKRIYKYIYVCMYN